MKKQIETVIAGLGISMLCAAVVLAQESPLSTETKNKSQYPQGEAPDEAATRLGEKLDRLFEEAVNGEVLPGAVVTVVQDGRVVFARGYGLADREKMSPADPETTLFYLGSITKLFTATAVMQLSERRRIDLDADVNMYVRQFQVPAAFHEPVTLEHILTHTAGFDDKNIGYVSLTAEAGRPLAQYLAEEMPPRVMPPGRVTSYSNHAYGLAGHIVSEVSGVGFADYLEQQIFKPLGMSRTTARIPLPETLAGDLAQGYELDYRSGRFEPQPLGFRNLPPAGTVSSTATDMARFMIAHLHDGEFEGARILRPETARRMHRQQFTHHPSLPGMAFGFYERFRGPVRTIEHAGSYLGYSAVLALVPEHDLGIFIAANSSSLDLISRALKTFLDHYFSAGDQSHEPEQPGPSSTIDLGRLAGSYHLTRYSRRTVEKFALWDGIIRVTPIAQGTIQLRPRNQPASDWVEVEPLIFRSAQGHDLLAFRVDSTGSVTHMFSNGGTGFPAAHEKLPWFETLEVQIPFVLSIALVAISTFTLWPLAGALRRIAGRRGRRPAGARSPRLPVHVAVVNAVLFVVLVAGLDTWLGNSAYRLRLVYGMTPEMIALLWIPIILTALAPALAYFAVQAWRRGHWSVAGRLYYSLVAVSAIAQVLFFLQWNLLGFRY